MENGFTIEVSNNTSAEKEIKLFTQDGLEEGVIVKVVNSDLDYNFLLNIAKNKGFKGSGIMINTELINCITIHDVSKLEIVGFEKMLIEKKISINGTSNFISLTVPPSSHLVLQLLPILN